MVKPSILWIDDDEALIEITSEYLEKKGFAVTACLDGETGISKAINFNYDIILLDIMLPSINGLHVLKVLQNCTSTPVIMLTASSIKKNELIGLESGALDYINKPCDLDVLIARINRTLKISETTGKNKKDKISFCSLTLDLLKREVTVANALLELTNSEYEVLKVLVSHAEQGISKKELFESALERAWQPDDKNLDTHIKNIRRKLSQNKSKNDFQIKTLYGFGYRLARND